MKPTRSRVFCPAYGHHKILFESEQAAKNFIRYNKDEILEENGKAPIRAYYCDVCGGWHVTSAEASQYESSYESLTHRWGAAQQYEELKNHYSTAQELLNSGNYLEAVQKAINSIKLYVGKKMGTPADLQSRALTMFFSLINDALLAEDQRLKQAIEMENEEYVLRNIPIFNLTLEQMQAIAEKNEDYNRIWKLYKKRVKAHKSHFNEAKSRRAAQQGTGMAVMKEIAPDAKLSPYRTVLKSDVPRVYELLELSQSTLQEHTPYESLQIAYDAFDLYLRCRAKNYITDDEEINTSIYIHIINIIMKFVADVDKHIQSNAIMQAEIELDEFLNYLNDKFSPFDKDEKMNTIYKNTQSILEQKLTTICLNN